MKRNVYPSYNGDSETFNSISYADCAGIEIPKVRRQTIALVINNYRCLEYNNNDNICRTTQARSFTTLTTTPSSTPSRQSASPTPGQRQNCELDFFLGSLEVFSSLETLAKPSWRFGDGVSFLEPQKKYKLLRVVILTEV